MTSREDLENNPEFLHDIASELTKKQIMSKWNCSSGFVVKHRKAIGRIDDSRAKREAGEQTEISELEGGGLQINFIRHRPVTLDDARDLIRSTGDNPDLYNLSIRAIAYGRDQSSNRISASPKTGIDAAKAAPLAELYKAARKLGAGKHRGATGPTNRSTVIVVSDWQIGKTGRRGGTPELLHRLEQAREAIRAELEKRGPSRIVILDGGDGIEGFESGGNPMFTNDLSLPDQIDCYATELYKLVALADDYATTEAGVVPSNHAAWRRGKQTLGRPSDDFGILAHKQVAKVAAAAGRTVTWHYPEEYDESLCVDVQGTPIGLVHGNQFGQGKAIDWWQAQAFGSQAVTRADVLVTGHYHTWGSGVAGINATTGRERYWLGAPTLDNGSDWFRNVAGRDSLPGTMIFDVTDAGFDLGSLKIV